MTKALKNFREVYVVGTGLHPYQYMSATPYVTLGLQAIRAALDDAKVAWNAVESAHIGTALLGMAPGRAMLRYLGFSSLEEFAHRAVPEQIRGDSSEVARLPPAMDETDKPTARRPATPSKIRFLIISLLLLVTSPGCRVKRSYQHILVPTGWLRTSQYRSPITRSRTRSSQTFHTPPAFCQDNGQPVPGGKV